MKDKLLNAMREASERMEKVSYRPKVLSVRDIPSLMETVSNTKNSKEKRIRTAMLLTAFGL